MPNADETNALRAGQCSGYVNASGTVTHSQWQLNRRGNFKGDFKVLPRYQKQHSCSEGCVYMV